MTVRVLYFASLRDRTGASEETIDVPPGSSVESLWTLLSARHLALTGLRPRPMVACDGTYATWDSPLAGVIEVAFLPPMSGG